MQSIINDIKNYIKYLSDKYQLEITICDLCSEIYPFFNLFTPYTSHRCNYCVYLKKVPAIQKKCVLKQSKIQNKCLSTDHFSGFCHAGLSEYIFRLMHNDTYLGFISIGEFCFDKDISQKKLDNIISSYNLPASQVNMYFKSSIRKNCYTIEELQKLINPLQRMIELFYLYATNQSKNKNTIETDSLLNDIILYLTENYANNITLSDISQALHYSKTYLCHYFFTKRNMTIMYYIQTLRLEHSKLLLKESQFSISEIAFQVGFNDANYFTNCFKKHIGCSPLKYRKINKKDT